MGVLRFGSLHKSKWMILALVSAAGSVLEFLIAPPQDNAHLNSDSLINGVLVSDEEYEDLLG